MKKNGKTKGRKVVYEENPWGDDEPILGKIVKDFLPPPHILKKAKIIITRNPDTISLELKDEKRLEKQAKKVGITPEALISAVIRDYLHGHLVSARK